MHTIEKQQATYNVKHLLIVLAWKPRSANMMSGQFLKIDNTGEESFWCVRDHCFLSMIFSLDHGIMD